MLQAVQSEDQDGEFRIAKVVFNRSESVIDGLDARVTGDAVQLVVVTHHTS